MGGIKYGRLNWMEKQMKHCKAFISGISGLALTKAEKAFIAAHQPWGFILFARNIEGAWQLRILIDSLREVSGRADALVFVDQEGGRIQRLRLPLTSDYPSAAELGAIYRRNKNAGLRAAWIMSRLHAFDLAWFGFNADCLPLLDVFSVEERHDVIGPRAYGHDLQAVTAMGCAAALGLQAGGILPVMKHIPGHGRAMCDTHKVLAYVGTPLEILRASDFMSFKALSSLPCAMTAHVVYEAVDHENPATLSQKVIETVIQGEIGFDGLLMTDDLSMKALAGDIGTLSRRAFMAGCDLVLHCNGNMDEMLSVAENTPWLSGKGLERAQVAAVWGKTAGQADDEAALQAEFHALLSSDIGTFYSQVKYWAPARAQPDKDVHLAIKVEDALVKVEDTAAPIVNGGIAKVEQELGA